MLGAFQKTSGKCRILKTKSFYLGKITHVLAKSGQLSGDVSFESYKLGSAAETLVAIAPPCPHDHGDGGRKTRSVEGLANEHHQKAA